MDSQQPHLADATGNEVVTYARHNVFGMSLPVIAELPQGYKLVLHKNGPGIATDHCLTILEGAVLNPDCHPVNDLFDQEQADEEIPYTVRRAAVQEYAAWSWPQLASQFDFS